MSYRGGIFGQTSSQEMMQSADAGRVPASPSSGGASDGSYASWQAARRAAPAMTYQPPGGVSVDQLALSQLPPPVNGGALPECPAGYSPLPDGSCMPMPNGAGPPPSCSAGWVLDQSGQCVMVPAQEGWWARQPTGIKVAIGVGGLLVVGGLIYLAIG